MKSIIYIGMDVHKKTYSLCALLKETGEIIGETKIPADVSLIIKFIENAKKSVDSDDVQITLRDSYITYVSLQSSKYLYTYHQVSFQPPILAVLLHE